MNINSLVINEMIGIRIGQLRDDEIGPNSKVEVKNLGLPKSIAQEDLKPNPDYYKNFNKSSLPSEVDNHPIPMDLSTGSDAGERLKNAIRLKHKIDKDN